MSRVSKTALIGLSFGAAVTAWPSAVAAQVTTPHRIPKGWAYEVDSRGNRVAKVNRLTRPDGSWREEVRQGNCLSIRERSATGEYKETTQCTGGKGG